MNGLKMQAANYKPVAGYFKIFFAFQVSLSTFATPSNKNARMAELVDALVSNTCGKPCRFDSGSGYLISLNNLIVKALFILFKILI